MLKDITNATPLPNHRLHLTFEDGVSGEVNVADLVSWSGVFAPLAQQSFFDQVQVDAELGTVVWPNGADLDPDVLYALVSGEPLPDFTPVWAHSSE
ncbi:MAG: DUF2442 domain-containing protein [Chloroflexota bacterium]